MIAQFQSALAGLAGLVLGVSAACAHPHVFVTMKTELVYAPDGTLTGVRHAWTFDDMFSTYATQGIEQKTKGVFSREELAPLAEVNVTSLKEYDFFTYAKADGKKVPLSDPRDYWLDFRDDRLTLNFTLPLKAPVRARLLDVEMYDPTYFVAFTFADKEPVTLGGAPARCALSVQKPEDSASNNSQRLSEAFFNQPSAQSWGAQFANKIAVKC